MIYADFNGSSLLYPEVKQYLLDRIANGPFANPNSIHSQGKKIHNAIENTRNHIARILGADANQVIFNSGASEGISHIFAHLTQKRADKKIIVISTIEHAAVRNAAYFYEKDGFKVIEVGVDQKGVVLTEQLEQILNKHQDNICMVSIMAANNETGVVQPYQEIAKLCHTHNAPFFSDTTQYIGKTDFNFSESGIDFATCSSHKIGALIGSGFILVKNPHEFSSFIFGGGQEKGFRGGTQNYISIETMAVALDFFSKQKTRLMIAKEAKESFENNITELFPEIVILGRGAKRLAGTCLMSFPGIHGQALQIELEAHDIFVTTSSACSDNQPETSRVLKAMGITDDIGRGVIRISLCCSANSETFLKITEALTKIYQKLKKIEHHN